MVFLPASDLKPVQWIKAVAKLSEVLDDSRKSPDWLSKLADSSALESVSLIVRPAPSSRSVKTVRVFIEVDGKEFEAKVPARKGRGATHFNEDHQWLIWFSKNDEEKLRTIKEMALELASASGTGWTDAKVSQVMNALRAGIGSALKEAGLPQGLADKMFPEGQAGVSGHLRRENVLVPDPSHQ